MSHLQLLFEETIVEDIVPHLDAQGVGFPIRCAIEHAEADGETVFSVTYGGDGFNPLKDADDLSGKLIRGIPAKSAYTYGTDNRLVLTL